MTSCKWAALTALLAALSLVACKATNTATPQRTAQATRTAIPQPPPAPASPSPPRPQTTVVARPGVPGQIVLSPSGPQPAEITIQAGRSVTWVNATPSPQRIVSDEPGLFDTGAIMPGQSASVTLTATGEHRWHAANDPGISGSVTVLP